MFGTLVNYNGMFDPIRYKYVTISRAGEPQS